jgi:aryl-alcohol dehydrogenase-like predicted oxidoreductase
VRKPSSKASRAATVVLLIPGASSVRHLEQNLAVANIKLDENARTQLAAATQ